MDEVGIWSQVLYPNVAAFGGQRFLSFPDDELKIVCVRAYNDFLRDWASADHRRLITIMATPFWDVDAAVEEVARCAEAGHRGILFTGEPHRFGLPYLGERHWDPLWAAAQDAGLPVHFHIGSGDMASSWTPERCAAHGNAATYAFTSVEMFLKNGLQVADLLTSGILPRFPNLQFVSVESGVGWIPFVLEALDWQWKNNGVVKEHPEWDLLPSEYFRRQIFASFWFEEDGVGKALELYPDNILFETDYPHPTCQAPGPASAGTHPRLYAERALAGIPEPVVAKVLQDTATKLYGLH
jgi:predicted TIM-barrel fold metal-dependent hydrolase